MVSNIQTPKKPAQPKAEPHPLPDEILNQRYQEYLDQSKREEDEKETPMTPAEEDEAIIGPYYQHKMAKAWEDYQINKIGVSEADGSGTPQSMAGFGLTSEVVPGDNKKMPQNIQNEANMKRKIVGNEGYTDIDNPHTDSFYLPNQAKHEDKNASEKTEGKKLLTEDNKVHRKEQKNTGLTAVSTI